MGIMGIALNTSDPDIRDLTGQLDMPFGETVS
jgi:hypothetical protein